MKPLKLKLFNVFQYEDKVVSFFPGVTGITGRNGIGKSNFMAALFFSVTGKIPGDTTKEDMLRWGADSGYTVLEFEHGGEEYALKRAIPGSSVRLAGGDLDKPLISAAANQFMEQALGMDFDKFYRTCWTPQGTLTDIIDKSHGDRVAFMQKLADTARAERIRAIVQERGLNKLPAYPSRADEIREATAVIRGLEMSVPELTEALEQARENVAKLADGLTEARSILTLPTETDWTRKCNQASAEVARCDAYLRKFRTDTLPQVEPVEEVPAEWEDARQKQAQKERLRALLQSKGKELAAAEETLTKGEQAGAGPDVAALRKEVQTLREAAVEAQPSYRMAKEGACPTCKRPYEFEGGAEEQQELIQLYEALVAEGTQKRTILEEAERKQTAREQATRAAVNRRDSLQISVRETTASLEELGDATHDEEVYQARKKARSAYITYLNEKQRFADQDREAVAALERAEVRLAGARDEKYATDEEIQLSKTLLEKKADGEQICSKKAEALTTAKVRLEAAQDNLARYEGEHALFSKTERIRHLFERAREVLHRDNLPTLVMQKLLFGVNTLLDQYLTVFETCFTAYLDGSFDFRCNFEEQADVPARVLSGGQKVALALAFKFAVADLLTGSAPFMVLDEPTVWLDEINKPLLAEVLVRVRSVAEKGVFVLVATHEPVLLPSMSRVINLSK